MNSKPTLLSPDEVTEALKALRDWSGDTTAISRTVRAPSFTTGIDLVRRVADIAEEMNHHPDIDIRWRNVTFTLATHVAGGVTVLDVELAGHIDQQAARSA